MAIPGLRAVAWICTGLGLSGCGGASPLEGRRPAPLAAELREHGSVVYRVAPGGRYSLRFRCEVPPAANRGWTGEPKRSPEVPVSVVGEGLEAAGVTVSPARAQVISTRFEVWTLRSSADPRAFAVGTRPWTHPEESGRLELAELWPQVTPGSRRLKPGNLVRRAVNADWLDLELDVDLAGNAAAGAESSGWLEAGAPAHLIVHLDLKESPGGLVLQALGNPSPGCVPGDPAFAAPAAPAPAVAAGPGLCDRRESDFAQALATDDPAVAQACLNAGISASAPLASGSLPLYRAAHAGSIAALTVLLDRGAPVNAQAANGCTAVFAAARHGRLPVLQLLLQRGADPDLLCDGNPPLMAAISWGQDAEALALLAGGADPNVYHKSGKSPLILAAETGNVPVVRALLERGADRGHLWEGRTAYEYVSHFGGSGPRTEEILRLLR